MVKKATSAAFPATKKAMKAKKKKAQSMKVSSSTSSSSSSSSDIYTEQDSKAEGEEKRFEPMKGVRLLSKSEFMEVWLKDDTIFTKAQLEQRWAGLSKTNPMT